MYLIFLQMFSKIFYTNILIINFIVQRFCISSKFRRYGIGNLLIETAEDRLLDNTNVREKGLNLVLIATQFHNAALSLFKKLNFETIYQPKTKFMFGLGSVTVFVLIKQLGSL